MADERKLTEHHAYPLIANTTTFGRGGAGPTIVPLTVVAALTPSTNYPRSRITLCNVHGNTCLTVHQAAQLRDQLELAIAEVVKSCPEMSTPDDVEQLPKEIARG